MSKWYTVEVTDLTELLKGPTGRELLVDYLSSDRVKVRSRKAKTADSQGRIRYTENLVVKFKNEIDATAFKLRWT